MNFPFPRFVPLSLPKTYKRIHVVAGGSGAGEGEDRGRRLRRPDARQETGQLSRQLAGCIRQYTLASNPNPMHARTLRARSRHCFHANKPRPSRPCMPRSGCHSNVRLFKIPGRQTSQPTHTHTPAACSTCDPHQRMLARSLPFKLQAKPSQVCSLDLEL